MKGPRSTNQGSGCRTVVECLHNHVTFNVNINIMLNSSTISSHIHIVYSCCTVCVKTFSVNQYLIWVWDESCDSWNSGLALGLGLGIGLDQAVFVHTVEDQDLKCVHY